MPTKNIQRCSWCNGSELYQAYHDDEWGVPLHDDHALFEFLCLEGAQAGLSWITVLKKRDAYRQLFADFDIKKVSRFSDKKLEKILENPAIIRNRLKVYSVRSNALACIEIQQEFGSFDSYLWQFVENSSIQNHWQSLAEIPANTALSDKLSKDLKKRGFKFIGSTIVYAFMQATGMVNDHITACYRHQPCTKNAQNILATP